MLKRNWKIYLTKKNPSQPGLTCYRGHKIEITSKKNLKKKHEDQFLINQILKDEIEIKIIF